MSAEHTNDQVNGDKPPTAAEVGEASVVLREGQVLVSAGWHGHGPSGQAKCIHTQVLATEARTLEEFDAELISHAQRLGVNIKSLNATEKSVTNRDKMRQRLEQVRLEK
jgi:hypothetical protein